MDEIKEQKGTIEQMRAALTKFSKGEAPDVSALIASPKNGSDAKPKTAAAAPAAAVHTRMEPPSAANAPALAPPLTGVVPSPPAVAADAPPNDV